MDEWMQTAAPIVVLSIGIVSYCPHLYDSSIVLWTQAVCFSCVLFIACIRWGKRPSWMNSFLWILLTSCILVAGIKGHIPPLKVFNDPVFFLCLGVVSDPEPPCTGLSKIVAVAYFILTVIFTAHSERLAENGGNLTLVLKTLYSVMIASLLGPFLCPLFRTQVEREQRTTPHNLAAPVDAPATFTKSVLLVLLLYLSASAHLIVSVFQGANAIIDYSDTATMISGIIVIVLACVLIGCHCNTQVIPDTIHRSVIFSLAFLAVAWDVYDGSMPGQANLYFPAAITSVLFLGLFMSCSRTQHPESKRAKIMQLALHLGLSALQGWSIYFSLIATPNPSPRRVLPAIASLGVYLTLAMRVADRLREALSEDDAALHALPHLGFIAIYLLQISHVVVDCLLSHRDVSDPVLYLVAALSLAYSTVAIAGMLFLGHTPRLSARDILPTAMIVCLLNTEAYIALSSRNPVTLLQSIGDCSSWVAVAFAVKAVNRQEQSFGALFAMALHVVLQALTAWSILEANSEETPAQRLFQLEFSAILLKMLLHEHIEHLPSMTLIHERANTWFASWTGRREPTPPTFPEATMTADLLSHDHLSTHGLASRSLWQRSGVGGDAV